VIRKNLSGVLGPRVAKLNEDIYRPSVTEKTYAKIAGEAERQILAGRGAILDATFGRRSHRERIARLAAKHKTPLLIIHCSTSERTVEKRLRFRAAQEMDVSDARWETYAAQKAAYEAMEEFRRESVLELDTAGPLERLVGECEKFLRSRLS
jgi:predicted kinase